MKKILFFFTLFFILSNTTYANTELDNSKINWFISKIENINDTQLKKIETPLNTYSRKNLFRTKIFIEDNTLIIKYPYWLLEKYWEDFNYILRNEIINYLIENNYKDWNKNLSIKINKVDNYEYSIIDSSQVRDLSKDDIILKYLDTLNLKSWKEIFSIKNKERLYNLVINELYKEIRIDNIDKLLDVKNISLFVNKKNFDLMLEKGILELTTFRERENVDKEYREHNISTAFKYFWTTRNLMPNESISFIDSISYDEFTTQEKYMYWPTLLRDESTGLTVEWRTYWWGLCWAATGLYQWIMTNKWIDVTDTWVHSWWADSLYKGNINWELVKTPWIDATIYMWGVNQDWTFWWRNLQFKNITNTPIILFNDIVTTDDWKKYEQNFTISSQGNKGSIKYIWKTNKCYTLEINWEQKVACYQKVNWY